MGEFIELIGQLKPKNNGSFPIADVNDLLGGYIQLDYIYQLEEHRQTTKLKQGMLAYVTETNRIYQYQQGIWIPWSGGSGGYDGASIDNPEFIGVFKDSKFDLFYGLRGTNTNNLTRGLMYPPDLFKYNAELTSVLNLFENTNIPVGVDINSDLFKRNLKLRNISGCWTDCTFNKKPYNTESLPSNPTYYPQIDFSNIFKSNIRIVNASNLFAVYDTRSGKKGLQMISSELLQTALLMNNISGMFYHSSLLTGAVPLFQANIYTALNSVSSYLTGVNKNSILNADLLEPRLIPLGWN